MKSSMIAIALLPLILAGCDDARVASRNLSRAAENFEIDRRIVFSVIQYGHEPEAGCCI